MAADGQSMARIPSASGQNPALIRYPFPYRNTADWPYCPRQNERESPMSVLTTARAGARMVFNHPELVRWYFRNKIRVSGLAREQNTQDGQSRYPLGITFKPTLSCNLRCKMCSFVANGAVFTNPKDSLPLEVWQGVVDDV